MSIVVEGSKAGKTSRERRNPTRYTPRIKFAEQPAQPAPRKVVLPGEHEARMEFFATLPVVESVVMNTTEKHDLLQLVVACRRQVASASDTIRKAAEQQFKDLRHSLELALVGTVQHRLWRLEGQRAFLGKSPNFPNLNRAELWAAGMAGTRYAVSTGIAYQFHTYLADCIANACRKANAKAEPGAVRTLRPRGFGSPTGWLPENVRRAYALADGMIGDDDDETRWEPTPEAMKGGVR